MAWAFGQSRSSFVGAAATSIPLAFTGNNAAGSLLVVTGACSGTGTTITASDGLNGVYTQAVAQNFSTSFRITTLYFANCAAGANTVTVNFSASVANRWIYITEYTGLDTTSPLDQVTGATGTSTTPDSGSVTATNANELVYGFCLAGTTASAGAGFSMRENSTGNIQEDKDSGSAGASVSAAFTQSPSGAWGAVVATFKVPGGGGGGTTVKQLAALGVG